MTTELEQAKLEIDRLQQENADLRRQMGLIISEPAATFMCPYIITGIHDTTGDCNIKAIIVMPQYRFCKDGIARVFNDVAWVIVNDKILERL